MASLTVVSASRKKKSGGGIPKGKLIHIHVEPMDNGGYSVESRHKVEPKKVHGAGKGSMMAQPLDYDAGTHKAGFADAASAHAHLGSLMGLGGSAPAAPAAPAAPTDGAGAAPPEPDEDEG